MGRFDGSVFRLGDEEFNLRSIFDSVVAVGNDIAPAILELVHIEQRLTVHVGPPSNDSEVAGTDQRERPGDT